jgi:hypothetical protein
MLQIKGWIYFEVQCVDGDNIKIKFIDFWKFTACSFVNRHQSARRHISQYSNRTVTAVKTLNLTSHSVKINLEVGQKCVNWIHLAQDRDQW